MENANWNLIPNYMRGAVERWINNGIAPGSFLTALVSNDLKETFSRADDTNAACIRDYMSFFYSYAPAGCWGSPARFSAWEKTGGIEGLKREAEAEDAYQRQQDSLTESGGPDDSSYRRDMINAGRGHLLR